MSVTQTPVRKGFPPDPGTMLPPTLPSVLTLEQKPLSLRPKNSLTNPLRQGSKKIKKRLPFLHPPSGILAAALPKTNIFGKDSATNLQQVRCNII